jgi:hypothetical protein
MNLAGFCRNCLAKWYRAAAAERGLAGHRRRRGASWPSTVCRTSQWKADVPEVTDATPFERTGRSRPRRTPRSAATRPCAVVVDRFYDLHGHCCADCAAACARCTRPTLDVRLATSLYLVPVRLAGRAAAVRRAASATRGCARATCRFAIDTAARDQWMACMRDALAAEVGDVELRAYLDRALAGLADHMRNQPG